jgi:hypothetical protein
MHRAASWLPFVIAAAAVPAQQTIRVPQDQPTLEAAFAAAADGDRVQLTQSSYAIGAAGLTLAKSLVVETVGNAVATIVYPVHAAPFTATQPALSIFGFGSGSRIVLRNLQFTGGYSSNGLVARHAVIDVQLATATGELVLENVRAVGELRHVNDSCPGLRLSAGAAVRISLRNSHFEGATGQSPMFAWSSEIEYDGSAGAVIDAAGAFTAENCDFVGGAGGRSAWSWAPYTPSTHPPARDGGDAARLVAPLGSASRCRLLEGAGGELIPNGTPTPPNTCLLWGAPGSSVLATEVYDCTRTFTPSGCGQTPQTVAINPGRSDMQPIPSAQVGVPFAIAVRPLALANGLTFWIFGSGLDSVALPGLGGRLYVANAFVAGLVPPPAANGWSTIPFPAPPAALPFLPGFAVQPLHLDLAGQLQLGAVATFTVLVP